MSREIRTFKASPVGEGEVPSLSIMFDQEIPAFEGLKGLEESGKAYRMAAKEIVEAMGKSLPGGLFDAILVEMMQAKISLFRVPHFTEEADSSSSEVDSKSPKERAISLLEDAHDVCYVSHVDDLMRDIMGLLKTHR